MMHYDNNREMSLWTPLDGSISISGSRVDHESLKDILQRWNASLPQEAGRDPQRPFEIIVKIDFGQHLRIAISNPNFANKIVDELVKLTKRPISFSTLD